MVNELKPCPFCGSKNVDFGEKPALSEKEAKKRAMKNGNGCLTATKL